MFGLIEINVSNAPEEGRYMVRATVHNNVLGDVKPPPFGQMEDHPSPETALRSARLLADVTVANRTFGRAIVRVGDDCVHAVEPQYLARWYRDDQLVNTYRDSLVGIGQVCRSVELPADIIEIDTDKKLATIDTNGNVK